MQRLLPLILSCLAALPVLAQNPGGKSPSASDKINFGDPTFVPMVKLSKVVDSNGDSIQYMEMNNVYVYPAIEFSDKKQAKAYMQLVKNVKTVLPIAKEVHLAVIETYEYIQTLPTPEERDAHLKYMEKAIMRDYKPRMKKLTFSQGKLLIKLIDRECNSTSYEIVKAFLGPLRAGFYQTFAAMFGASMKKQWDPQGVDRLTERIVLMVEAGQL